MGGLSAAPLEDLTLAEDRWAVGDNGLLVPKDAQQTAYNHQQAALHQQAAATSRSNVGALGQTAQSLQDLRRLLRDLQQLPDILPGQPLSPGLIQGGVGAPRSPDFLRRLINALEAELAEVEPQPAVSVESTPTGKATIPLRTLRATKPRIGLFTP